MQKQKGGGLESPAECLAKALYVLNYLRLRDDRVSPPIVVHQVSLQAHLQKVGSVKVQYKDLSTGEWRGPVEVQRTGRGYVCVLTEGGLRWVPARWIRPCREELGSLSKSS